MLTLIGGQDEQVAEWAGRVLEKTFVRPFSAFGIAEADGTMRGAAIFNDYYPNGNIEMTYIGRGTVQRHVLRELAVYAFDRCKALRVTCKTKRGNIIARRLLPRLGFAFEGTQKRYFGPAREDDSLCFVLTRDKAVKWLGEADNARP